MTEIECKQACANMSAAQLLPNLYKAEAALNAVYDVACRKMNLEKERDDAVQSLTYEDSLTKGKLIATIIMAAAAILFFILSKRSKLFLAGIFMLAAIFFLICTVCAFISLLFAYKKVKDLKKQVPKLEADFAEAETKLEQAKAQHNDWLLIRQWICPQECYNPKHMRMFVSYFEDRRADNLKEARNLFDEYMHRQRMEGTANAQLAASRAAVIAADEARIAAQNAAFTAQQAKTSADWAAYHARNK